MDDAHLLLPLLYALLRPEIGQGLIMYIMEYLGYPQSELIDLLLSGTLAGFLCAPSQDPIDQVASSRIGRDEEVAQGLFFLEDLYDLQDVVTIQHASELAQQEDLLILVTLLLPPLALLELLYRHLFIGESISTRDGGLAETGIDDSKAASPQEDILVELVLGELALDGSVGQLLPLFLHLLRPLLVLDRACLPHTGLYFFKGDIIDHN